MKRFGISKRDLAILQCDYNHLQVVHRTSVAPGSTLNMEAVIKVRSDPLSKVVMNPLMMALYFFYVPYRLLWDDWVPFIAQDPDYAGTFPVVAGDWHQVLDVDRFEGAGTSHSSMARRAFKLIYNNYFGDDEFSNYYADITLDTDVTEYFLKTPEQIAGKIMPDSGLEAPTFDATTVPIDLNEFWHQLQQARSKRRAQATGDQYVDAMRRMGVDVDWKIQNSPEFLGMQQMIVDPKLVSATDTTSLGKGASRYEFTIEGGFQKKRFAEHGLIIGLVAPRPMFVHHESPSPLDGTMVTIDDFYLGDDSRRHDEIPDNRFSNSSVEDAILPRHSRYLYGSNVRTP